MVIKKIIKVAAKKGLKSKGRLKTKAQVKRMRTAAIKAKYDQIDAKTNKKGRVDAQGRGIVSYKSAAERKRDIARASKSKKHLQTWKRFIKTKQGSDMIKNRKVLKLSEQREVGYSGVGSRYMKIHNPRKPGYKATKFDIALKKVKKYEAAKTKKRKSFIRQGPSWWTKSMEDNYSGQTRKQARKNIATAKTKKERIHAIAAMWGYSSLRESEKREIGYSGFGGRHGYNYKENVETLRAGKKLPKRPGTVKQKKRFNIMAKKNQPTGSVTRNMSVDGTPIYERYEPTGLGSFGAVMGDRYKSGKKFGKIKPKSSAIILDKQGFSQDGVKYGLTQSEMKKIFPRIYDQMHPSFTRRTGSNILNFFADTTKTRTDKALWGTVGGLTATLPPLIGHAVDLNKKKSKKKTIPKGQRDLKAEQKAYEDEVRGEPGPYSAYPSP